MRPVTLNTGHTQAEFDALLASGEFAVAEAYTLRLVNGVTLAYTDAQYDFIVPPVDGSLMQQTYVAGDVLVKAKGFSISNGTDTSSGDPTISIKVDEQTVTFTPNANPDAPSTIQGVDWLVAVGRRVFSGGVFQRDRWFAADARFKDPVGGVPVFYGYMGAVDQLTRTQAVVKVKGDPVLLNKQMPCNLYQPNCQYTVYSSPCGAVKASFAVHDVVGASPSRSFIPWASATAQYTSGEIFFDNGPNTGEIRTIRKADATGLWLAYPLPYLPIAGDEFTAYPGCNRQDPLLHPGTSGCVFFGRQAAFRATPHVPGAVFGI